MTPAKAEKSAPVPADAGAPSGEGDGETTTGGNGAPLRRAVMLMTASSFLVPAAGVLTQPILAQALGVTGRGELAASMAPHLLAVAAATLGLPEALTYFLAKYPSMTRQALLWTTPLCAAVSVLCLLTTFLALPFLSGDDARLANLIMIAVCLTLPALMAGVVQGAAIGRQMWVAAATDRLVSVVLRVGLFVVLLMTGKLTVLSALLVYTLAPIASCLVYWRLLFAPPVDPAEGPAPPRLMRLVVSYGNRVWLGSVASMLLSRLDQVLMAPLSSVEDVGLYSVARTVADVPMIVSLAIAGALFGVNSKSRDASNVAFTSRLTLLVSGLGCVVLGLVLPWWIEPLFGDGFAGALVPTMMLLVSALISMPGAMAAISVSAWGRPGLRSVGLAIALTVNLGLFVVLVPRMGVIGACWAGIVTNVVFTAYMTVTASRLVKVRLGDFFIVRGSDVARIWNEMTTLFRRIRRQFSNATQA